MISSSRIIWLIPGTLIAVLISGTDMHSKGLGPYGRSPESGPLRPRPPLAEAHLLTAKAKSIMDTAATRCVSEGLTPCDKAPAYSPQSSLVSPAQARLLIAKAAVAVMISPHPPTPMEKARPQSRRTVQEKAKPIRLSLAPMTKATLHAMMAVRGLREPQLQLALSDDGRSYDGRDRQ